MISKIHIQNTATIKDAEIEPLQINYFFGGNGSGKTSISRFLDDSENYNNGTIVKDSASEVLVYNRDFIDKNFQDKNAIQGIFTIGESAVETLNQIKEKEEEKAKLQTELGTRLRSIEKLQSEINTLEEDFETNCWAVQQKIGEQFSHALVGFRSKKKLFSDKCFNSYSPTESQLTIEELIKTYQHIFQKDIKEYSLLSPFLFSVRNGEEIIDIETIETAGVFSQKLVKANESNFSKLIERLSNVDWVSQGMHYLKDENLCPFCQRELTEDILSELNLLFDETYNQSIAKLNKLLLSYNKLISILEEAFHTSITFIQSIPFLDSEKIEDVYAKLIATLQVNQKKIEEKLLHPSIEVILSSTKYLRDALLKEQEELNEQIANNNRLLKNRRTAREAFIKNLWDYIANKELHSIIENYAKTLKGKNRGMANLLMQRDSFQQMVKDCEASIRDLRSKVACIDNAVDEVNKILTGFGFNGFKIEKKDEMFYKLIRPDGSEVKETLSEGEHRFITFLYYYQLVKGTLNRDSEIKDKILVIDDPISSLDSNILFIVSHLVRGLINECLKGGRIKQIFILTHNIYFHQEVVFRGSRFNPSPNTERYFILRKVNEETKIIPFEKNQINSSYELLWREIKRADADATFLCNTMRRILEHYFSIIGRKDCSQIIDEFDGQDKLICKSLLTFINEGSHIINDDFNMSVDPDMVDKYKDIFKLIFQKAGQESHYTMMMEHEE